MKKILLGASLVGAGAGTIATGLLCRRYTKAFRRNFREKDMEWYAGEENPYRELFRKGRQWAAEHRKECCRKVISNQGVPLVGYYYDQKADKTVIFVHGFDGSYLERLAGAEIYYERGYNVLSVICRGYGESGGEYRTLGYMDRLDVISWARYLVKRQGQQQIVLDGVSMGAAAVLAAAGDPKLPREVIGVVSDSAYTSIYDILAYQMEKKGPMPLFPFLNLVEAYGKKNAGISLIAHSPLESVKVSQVPVLFIHGVDDLTVPYEMGQELMEACTSSHDMLSVKGAGHREACLADAEGYRDCLERYLEKIEGSQ